jgi:tRNA(fMet)-specific endonuclease VapC
MKIALDSNRYADFCRGEPDVVRVLEQVTSIHLPLIVIAELRAGFKAGSRANENEDVLQRFLQKPGVLVLVPDDDTTRQYAELYYYLRQRATPIPTNDLWIAFLVLQHKVSLYTRDAHFDRLPQISRV